MLPLPLASISDAGRVQGPTGNVASIDSSTYCYGDSGLPETAEQPIGIPQEVAIY